MSTSSDKTCYFGLAATAPAAHHNNHKNLYPLYGAIGLFGVYSLFGTSINDWLKKNIILCIPPGKAGRVKHDQNRMKTYPDPILNTWYRLCNSEDLKPGQVLEIQALGQTFVVWRTEEGKAVIQDAFCIHLGANLGTGGTVSNNCITCPFHKWQFDSNGEVKVIPYLPKDNKCPTHRKLKTYISQEWCGLVCIYFHADDALPSFPLPTFIEQEIISKHWYKHLVWDIGHVALSPIDWVDQTGDHSHFLTLHNDFYIPWTTMTLPNWFLSLFPVSICHKLQTYLGDDEEWKDYTVAHAHETGIDELLNSHFIIFTDYVGLAWGKTPKAIDCLQVSTRELFVGPAIMVFHIPIFIGTVKVIVSTTPDNEGGSFMNARTWVDPGIAWNPVKRWITWVFTGISVSQLMSDLVILVNKIRFKKPLLVANDGPFMRSNKWLRQFYSESSSVVNAMAKGYKEYEW